MPRSRSLCRVRLTWHLRASAFRTWAQVIFLAALASSFSFDWRDDNPEPWIRAATAVWSWQTVSSGFFPRPFLPHPGQEQVAHATEDQVTFQAQVPSPLILIQPDLALLILEAAFDSPSRESNDQQSVNARARRCIADEELHLLRVQYVASHQQVERFTGQTVGSLDRQPYALALPDHRSFLPVLDAESLPRLIPELRILEQLVDPASGSAAAGQARSLT